MSGKIGKFLVATPTALSGLALAILSLGWCFEGVFELSGVAKLSSALVAALLLSIISFKFFFNPLLFKQELSHYIVGSMVPTFTMAMMMIANNINPYHHHFAVVLWLASIVMHLILMLIFTYQRIIHFNFLQLLPCWFIPPIGIAAAAISVPEGVLSIELLGIAKVSFIFASIAYAILLPVTFYRYLFCTPFAPHEQPTLAIFATPASLLLVGYLTLYDQPNYALVVFLAALALSMTFFIYYSFNQLLRLPFSPAYAAFTFPLVVGATAMFKLSHFLLNSGSEHWLFEGIRFIAYLELAIATFMVVYVCLRYMLHYFPFTKSVSH